MMIWPSLSVVYRPLELTLPPWASTYLPSEVVTRNSAPCKGFLVLASRLTMTRAPRGRLRNSSVTILPLWTTVVWGVSSRIYPALARLSRTMRVVPGLTSATVKEPEASVTYLPLAVPTKAPLSVVTMNSTPERGLPVAASTFLTSTEPLGWLRNSKEAACPAFTVMVWGASSRI